MKLDFEKWNKVAVSAGEKIYSSK